VLALVPDGSTACLLLRQGRFLSLGVAL
jgi:hypothetical protein